MGTIRSSSVTSRYLDHLSTRSWDGKVKHLLGLDTRTHIWRRDFSAPLRVRRRRRFLACAIQESDPDGAKPPGGPLAYDGRMTAKERITVSLPADLVEGAKAAVESGEATDVSAYVADALAARRAKRDSRRALDDLFADIGRPGPTHDEWARRALGLDGDSAGRAAA